MARARNFQELIQLIQRAEVALVRHGITDVSQRILMLRGIFYGTPWSREFSTEGKRDETGALIRNIGFTIFTGFGIPPDPRGILPNELIQSIRESQDINDNNLAIDIGHVFIGLEARNSFTARTISIPSQGGTGLEIVTWLGDLGGGAANLAWRRANSPRSTVSYVFSRTGSDYGAAINLEGDIGGYVIGSNGSDLTAPTYTSGGITALLSSYLPIRGLTPLWRNRSKAFLVMIGGAFNQRGALVNKSELIDLLKGKIYSFGVAYMTQRFLSTDLQRGARACEHLEGASGEVSKVFIEALERNISRPSRIIYGSAFPRPTAKGTCKSSVLQASTYQESIERTYRDSREAARDFLDGILSE